MKKIKTDYPTEKNVTEMKKLWQECFGDAENVIDNFFRKSMKLKNTLCAFIDNTLVGMLFLQECVVLSSGREYSAYYIYGVCTRHGFRKIGVMTELFNEVKALTKERSIDYLFLVPANDALFGVYKKQGFETSFYYEEAVCIADGNNSVKASSLGFEDYISYNKNRFNNSTVALLNEETFNSFMHPVSSDMGSLAYQGGYAVYEIKGESVVVFEYVGNEGDISAEILKRTCKNNIIFRKYSKNKSKPYGMSLAVSTAPKIENGFFGVPYSN